MKIIFILSDALRYDYINYMPFLSKMAEEHTYYEKVTPGIGFCEISEYVSGIDSRHNGNLFQLTFNGQWGREVFSIEAKINNFFNHIPRLRRYTQRFFDYYLGREKGLLFDQDILNVRYNIPLNLLNYFLPTESRNEYDSSEFFPETNLFLMLKRMGKSYDIDDFVQHNKIKGSDDDRLVRLKKKIERKELADFTLLYIGKGELAHMTGTKSNFFHDKLSEYDSKLREIKTLLDKIYDDNYRFVVLGDHGMVDIDKYIDIRPLIKQVEKECDLKIGEDYVYFIDSTALRLWFKDKRKKEQCNYIVQNHIKQYLDDFKVENEFYGDLIYVLKPGNVFFPDFFNTKKNKGMHGYNNKVVEQKGLCIIIGTNDKSVYPLIELHKVKKLILDLFKNV